MNEVLSLAFAVGVAACIPAGLARGDPIRVEVLSHVLGPRFLRFLDFLGAVLLFAVFLILAWQMGLYAGGLGSRATVVLRVPIAPFIWATTGLLWISAAVQGQLMVRTIGAMLAGQGARRRLGVESAAVVATLLAMLLVVLTSSATLPHLIEWAQDHSSLAVGLIFTAVWVAILLTIPITAAVGLGGLGGAVLLIGSAPALNAFATETAQFVTNAQIATLPLFLMMGSFAAIAGISDDLYGLAQALLKPFRGGLAAATIIGCAGFGALSGSSLATVATFGRVALPQMIRRGYRPEFAASCVAAGATLDAIIPPSGILIVYALLTQTSVGLLFIGAVIPALLCTTLYLLTVVLVIYRRPQDAPPGADFSVPEALHYARRCGPALVLFLVLFGGLFSGMFTSTEAAAVGAVSACILALARGKLQRGTFLEVMSEITNSVALIYTVIFGVLIFSFFIAVSGFAAAATDYFSTINIPPLMVILLIVLLYLVLGTMMDAFSAMLITVPVMIPLIVSMGYDLIWWGIVNLLIVEIGTIHPPFGIHLFILRAQMSDLPMNKIYIQILPFCAAAFLALVLIIVAPGLATWLPNLLF